MIIGRTEAPLGMGSMSPRRREYLLDRQNRDIDTGEGDYDIALVIDTNNLDAYQLDLENWFDPEYNPSEEDERG